jgi:polyketide synthase 13
VDVAIATRATVPARSPEAAARGTASGGVGPYRAADPLQIAVVGIGCRLPGGIGSPQEFWQALLDGRDAISTLPRGRWDGFADPGDPALAQVPRHGGFLEDIAGFDAAFFGIAPSEASAMDPQQRLLLEVTRESLDHAAIPADSLAGSRTGVFVGISGNEYARLTTARLDAVEAWSAPGAALSIAANRLSYALDLRGPSVAVDTACSSSLVAVHHAVLSLATGECDTALAAGVNLLLSPALTLSFQRAGALAADGRCKAFDAEADGMVRGEGCGVVVLRRLADAEAAGDRVLAVIRASAVNSDGRSNGLLAPNAEAQRALLAEVYGRRGVVPGTLVDYVEAHGTGTALGDPIEAGALGAVLGRGREPDEPLLVGSVKTNLGHLEAAAGIAGLIKTVLALHHGVVPPQLHFSAPNPHLEFGEAGLRVVAAAEPWPRYSGTATAGVSAFGFGGTNAHLVLQECRHSRELGPEPQPGREPQSGPEPRSGTGPLSPGAANVPSVLALDASTPQRLREDAADLVAWLTSARGMRAPIGDVARTLVGRLGKGSLRAAIVARTREQAVDALERLVSGQPHPAMACGSTRGPSAGPVLVFSGYGSQWPGMARRLLDEEPAFAESVERLEPLLSLHAGGLSLRACLESGAALTKPSVVQPVLFAVQVALADLWWSHGVRPAAVIGHSMGEIAAAVVAGCIDEEDGARIVGARSRLLDGLSGGAMAVVDRSAEAIGDLAATLLPSLRVAVHSSPGQCVVSGSARDVERLIALVSAEGGTARSLNVTAAGHTAQVDPLLGPLGRELGEISNYEPICPMYSTALDDPRSPATLGTAYWIKNLRSPVRFRQAVDAAAADGFRTFIEVSPHPVQLYPLSETLRAAGVADALTLPTLRRDVDDSVAFRSSIAALLAHGQIDPLAARRSLHPGARIIDLPSPRWRHRRFWADTGPVTDSGSGSGSGSDSGSSSESADAAPESADPSAREARRRRTTADRIRGCIADVTGYHPDSINEDTVLTDLGIDSLQAMRVVSLLKNEFGLEVLPRTLLRGATVAIVAGFIDGAAHEAAAGQPAHHGRSAGVLPRDATERLVARLWSTVSGAQISDVNAALDALDGDRGLADALAKALSEETSQRIDARDLAGPDSEASTVASIADQVRPLLEAPVAGALRVLRAQGSRPPLYLIHPAGGSSVVYRPLARRLDSDQPCFGLDRLAELTECGERAAHYARLIRARHPAGPWVLGGWSYGGLVAQETARLLQRHGEVRALILIDSVLPLPAPGLDRAQETRRRFAGFADYVHRTYGSKLTLPYDELALLDEADQIDHVIKALKHASDLPAAVLEHQRTSYLDLRSGERHRPNRYTGRTVLYRATEPAPHTVADARYQREDEALGWDEFCPDLLVRRVPGHHLSLLDPPVVDVLARLLDADLKS